MARLFDNSTSNYMSRASIDYGLNGATEVSFGYWMKITAVEAARLQRVYHKGIVDGTNTLYSCITTNTTQVVFGVEGQSTSAFPTWETAAGIGTGVWTRLLFTWKRNAISAADGIIYVNGLPVSTNYIASGYGAGTVLDESANVMTIGVRAFSITEPYNGALDWLCVWNRQLTAQEALLDYTNPRNVKSGLRSILEFDPNIDQGAIGGSATINGTLAAVTGPPIVSANPKFQNTLRARPFAPGTAR